MKSRSIIKSLYLATLVFSIAGILTACSDSSSPSAGSGLTPTTATTPDDTTEQQPTATPTPSIAPSAEERQAFYEAISEGYSIPIVSVYTEDRAEILSRDNYVTCTVDLFNCEDAYALNTVRAGIKVRGNSSAHNGDEDAIRNSTVPYRIKFDEKQSVLGMNNDARCRSWVLLKTDWDLIRNDIALRMGRSILREDAFCSDSRFVFLYVNEEFQGIYLLCEQCQVHKERVDISEPPVDYDKIDIGYYLELDNYAVFEQNSHYFTQNYAFGTATDIEGVTRAFVPAEYTIKNDIYSTRQVEFIELYMNELFSVLYDACTKGEYYGLARDGSRIPSDFTSSKEVAESLLDIDSVVDMYILYEIVHDYDCGEGSFFMCIDFSKESTCPKLRFTSPWDFNWTYYEEPAGQYYAGAFNAQSFVDQYEDRTNPWFVLLMTQDWFVNMVRERWTELQKDAVLETCFTTEEDLIATYWYDFCTVNAMATYSAYDILSWLRTRVEWLDSQWLLES